MTSMLRRFAAVAALMFVMAPAGVAFAEDDHAGHDHGDAHVHGDDHAEGAGDDHAHAGGDDHAHAAGDDHAHAEDGGHGDGYGHDAPHMDWVVFFSSVVNFAIYIGVLVFLGRKPVAAYFANRRSGIANEMEAAQAARAAAEAQLADTQSRIASLDDERANILAEFRELGEQERRQIVADAETEGVRIVRDAENAAELEVRRAKSALETRMVDLALELAEKQLAGTLTGEHQTRLIDDGIDALARGDVQA
jgi:F-type H+-transporting ATPase subunit b